MNNILNSKKNYWIAILIGLVFMGSCKKYNSLGFDPGTGTPTIASVHTWSKTDTTTTYDTIISYDAGGNVVKTLKQKQNRINAFDSTTTAGNLGNYYLISGTNLGSVTNITFNGYSAYFNRALLTDNSIVVQVPSKTPYYGPSAKDSLVVTTLYGKATYKFTIIAPPPTVSSYSNYDFYAGSQITLSGVGFASVTGVNLLGSSPGTATTSIISKNDSVLVLQFPTTTITRGILQFNYTSAGTATTLNAAQELVNLDNAYQIFTDGYQNSWENGSWSGQAGISTTIFKTGSASFMGVFPKSGWKIEGFQNWYPSLPYDASYKYLVFWVYGGAASQTVNIQTNTSSLGYGQNGSNPITVPPGVWTYFKIPISSISFWSTGGTLQQLGFFIKGPDSGDEKLYFDDVVLVK